MSPQLRELLLPQVVQDRKSGTPMDEGVSLEPCDLSYVYYTTNSSSSDVASPLTPTFSNRGVPLRYSSSTSSLELPPQEGPASPIAQLAAASKSSIRQLPDVQEEPQEREDEREREGEYEEEEGEEELEEEEEDYDDDLSDNLGMYCLCKWSSDGKKKTTKGASSWWFQEFNG
jgi:hypothetical protein